MCDKNIEIGMAEMKTDIGYIKKSLEENSNDHKIIYKLVNNFSTKINDELDKKADKKEVTALNNKILNGLIWVIILLVGIVGFLIKYQFFT